MSKWIKSSDRLPEPYQNVLIKKTNCFEIEQLQVIYINDDKEWQHFDEIHCEKCSLSEIFWLE